ncbi:regulator of hemoglobinization and erythroid cell expansion protein [Rhynchonycteris naso]
MKLWHGLVIAVVSLVLQACLLAAINYLLSRHMAKQNEQLLKRAKLQGPSPAHHHSPAAQEMTKTWAERGTPVLEPCYRHDIDRSTDSTNTSDSASSSSPTCQATTDVDYTHVVFSATGRLKNESSLDYEDIKEDTDYVNINPKSHKHDFWAFVNPAASEPGEYTQVDV